MGHREPGVARQRRESGQADAAESGSCRIERSRFAPTDDARRPARFFSRFVFLDQRRTGRDRRKSE
jgi:hypothetical protein